MMENGVQNGIATNHDRASNGPVDTSVKPAPASVDQQNGSADGATDAGAGAKQMTNGALPISIKNGSQTQQPPRLNDLPDEIFHMALGYTPLGVLLSRLAQRTHNELQAKVLELAKMPMPSPMVNGNSAHSGGLPDDTSVENISKKVSLLDFVQETHANWTKALVITAWSRKATTVSKLVDLMYHLKFQFEAYWSTFQYFVDVKRGLPAARLPNPDLRTALQVLSTGQAPWMPEFNFIEPPPLSAREQMEWIEELNTLLSIRLNLEDHDKIPYHFQNYTISSGRVTFRVGGEFEVDLTIADEDFDKQFWFIDFRFSFRPAPAELTDALRAFVEFKVNEALGTDGLQGCYNFLHEFVLTHKITEFVRQAFELSRASWVDTLKVERLNRAMSIQYWCNRFPFEAPKSWVILGINSGKKPGATPDPSVTSHLSLRLFRDNKEIKDVAIPIDDENISTERLLKIVIARHVEHILSTIYNKLRSKGRFIRREAALSLSTSKEEPVDSSLQMQLGYNDYVTIRMVPNTGFFSMTPQLVPISNAELNLNWKIKDATEEGLVALERMRCQYTLEEMNRRGKSLGWSACKGPVKPEDVKPLLQSREAFQTIWFRRRGWQPAWYLMITLGLGGDKWWLLEVSPRDNSGPIIRTYASLPLSSSPKDFNAKFFSSLTLFTSAMISRIADLRALHARRIKHMAFECRSPSLPPNMKFPAMFIRLTDVLKAPLASTNKARDLWAADFVQIKFKDIEEPRSKAQKSVADATESSMAGDKERMLTVVEARLKVIDRSKFSLLGGSVERDVAYNARLGVFALRLHGEVGSSILDTLGDRIQAIKRLVDCVDAIRRTKADIECQTITLGKVVFTYSDAIGRKGGRSAEANIRRWKACLDLRNNTVRMSLEEGNPHMRTLNWFNRLLNSKLGVVQAPSYLAFTLPVFKAFDTIEDSWRDLKAGGKGQVQVEAHALDHFSIHYTLPGPSPSRSRKLTLQMWLRRHGHDVEWEVRRLEPGETCNPDDDFRVALQGVWAAGDGKWMDLLEGASAEANDQAAALLKALDAAVRQLTPKNAPSPSVTKSVAARPQPQQMRAQQAVNQAMNQRPLSANRARPQQQQASNVVVLDD